MNAVFQYISSLPFDPAAPQTAYLDDDEGRVLSMAIVDNGSSSGIVTGRLASTRRDLLPQIELNGSVTDPTIPVGAGFYDPTHFAYFLDSDRVAIEVNGHGPHYSKFADYIERKLIGHSTVDVTDAALFPLISADVYKRLVVNGTIAEIEIEVYRGYGATIRNVANGLGDILSAMDNLPEGPTVFSIALKGDPAQGRTRSIGQAVQDEVVSLLRDGRSVVRRAIAKVRQPNPTTGRPRTNPVDLLEAKMVYYVRPVQVRSRVIDSTSMYAEIITGYQNFVKDEVR